MACKKTIINNTARSLKRTSSVDKELLSKKYENFYLNIFCRSKHINLIKFMYRDNKKIKFIRVPKFEEVPYPVVMEPNLVIEYYSR